jgi:hypothetical protein
MHSAGTLWRSSLAAGCLALLTECELGSKRPERGSAPLELPRRAPAAASDRAAATGPDTAAAVPSAIVETLRFVHEQKLEITPPSTPPQRLEFGRGRLLQAVDTKVVFLDTKQGDVVAEASIGKVRAVAHGADGSLFALGASLGVRLLPRLDSPQLFPHVAFFPDSTLLGDLEEPSHFYVSFAEQQQVYRYAFDGNALGDPRQAGSHGILGSEARIPLSGCTKTLAQLRDAAFVCRLEAGFARIAPRGRRTEFRASALLVEPFRLLPAARLDEFFALSLAGEVVHLRLAPGLPVLGRFQLPAAPYAAAANGEVLAFVTVGAATPGRPRRWLLVVTDFAGRPRFQTELPAQAASADEAWLEHLVEDKNLAISQLEPLVAVAGASHLTVWDYAQGRLRFSR